MANFRNGERGEWTSWTYFARDELGAPRGWGSQFHVMMQGIPNDPWEFEHLHGCGYMCKVLVEKMDHESSIFGLPSTHMESEALPDGNQTELKRRIAMEVIGGCLERVKIEALLKMEQRLEKEGLEGFKLILNGESIIGELAKVDVSCHSSEE